MFSRQRQIAVAVLFVFAGAMSSAEAQDQPSTSATMNMDMSMDEPGWHFMQDGVLYGIFNHQGGPRGGSEFKAPNWWMGMTTRKVRSSQLTINTMFSLDPATVGKGGYREIFQAGEALDGRPLIDHQHPHDFFMQLAGVWRVPINDQTGFTLAGGPAGEPALGPVAFMHRASAADNPFSPLSHHTLDSTHVAFGVITGAVDHGPWTLEASLFNGHEPDEDRWDIDLRALDSFSGRVWFRPAQDWEFQVSSARLKKPEELEEGNLTRTTASAGWFRQSGEDFGAVTIAFGRNDRQDSAQKSLLAEGACRMGMNSLFARIELHQAEAATLSGGGRSDLETVVPITLGGARDILRWRGFEGGFGAAATFYRVPAALAPSYGRHPVSFQIYFRLRPPAGSMGRMWNMRMSQPVKAMSHGMNHPM